jgi:hypothetical protein
MHLYEMINICIIPSVSYFWVYGASHQKLINIGIKVLDDGQISNNLIKSLHKLYTKIIIKIYNIIIYILCNKKYMFALGSPLQLGIE